MGRPSAGAYLVFLVVVLILQASLLLGKGVLLLDQHEGDALHLMQIILRMGAGEWPHLDFTTPIGILAFAPISWLISLGIGAGSAIMGGMVLFALVLLPLIWWVGYSRLSTVLALLFGAFLIVLATALVYGGDTEVSSISMYYNRWAWAAGALLVVLVMVPPGRENDTVDGLVVGLALSFLALSKITFFAALLPGVLLALLLRRKWRALVVAALVGVLVIGAMTALGGVQYWLAYMNDLRLVAASGIRPQPSASLAALLIGPGFLAANLALIAGIVLLRQAGQTAEGVILLIFAPGFVYITYQNWGNDPKWLFLLAILMLSLRPDRHINNGLGWNVGQAMGAVALVSGALILPSVFNLTFSDFRHARMSREGFFQVLPGHKNGDIAMKASRMYAPARRAAFSLRDQKLQALVQKSTSRSQDSLFGQPLNKCKLEMGLVGVLHQMARDLEKVKGIAGKSVFTADTFSNLWLFGSTVPLKGGAPWYYGGNAGMDRADFVLVPLCPVTPRARTLVLNEIRQREGQINLREVTRNDLFILLRRLPD